MVYSGYVSRLVSTSRRAAAMQVGAGDGGYRVTQTGNMLEIDAALAIAHHLLMFALLAILVMELTMTRPGLKGAQLGRLAALDLSYGAVAGFIIAVGVARVFLGLKDPGYYFANIFFWLKIICFIMVAMLSVPRWFGPMVGQSKKVISVPGLPSLSA